MAAKLEVAVSFDLGDFYYKGMSGHLRINWQSAPVSKSQKCFFIVSGHPKKIFKEIPYIFNYFPVIS